MTNETLRSSIRTQLGRCLDKYSEKYSPLVLPNHVAEDLVSTIEGIVERSLRSGAMVMKERAAQVAELQMRGHEAAAEVVQGRTLELHQACLLTAGLIEGTIRRLRVEEVVSA